MKFKDILLKLITYEGPVEKDSFTLAETDLEKQYSKPEASRKIPAPQPEKDRSGNEAPSSKDGVRHPKKISELKAEQATDEDKITVKLEANKKKLKELFYVGVNQDVVIRDFELATIPPTKALLIFLEGMADKQTINDFILKPLMAVKSTDPQGIQQEHISDEILKHYLPSNQVKTFTSFKEIANEVTGGSTALFFDGCSKAIAAETKGFSHRGVESAKNEQVVQGPQEGFVENLRSNTSLVRRLLRTQNLISEYMTVGKRNRASVAMMYLQDIANPKLVAEIKRRVEGISADYISESGMLEEFIEDHPFSLVPQTVKTERPDWVASMLIEGKVALIVDNNPWVIVVPGTFFDFVHSPEDYYVRYPYGYWLRLIRVSAIFLTLLLPSLYVALATFHQEMIPTDLLLSIAAAKEKVPFPTLVEVLLMELSFELIREAGVRVPGIIGPTLGIVGTLVLGQAAVAASIVSPILIIIVAVTGLASFAIPNYSVSFGFRFMRFIFIFLAATLGFFGISTGLFVLLCLMINMKSYGVPYFSPVAPRTNLGSDLIFRQPMWNQEKRPDALQTQTANRQPNISRKWLKRGSEQSDARKGETHDQGTKNRKK